MFGLSLLSIIGVVALIILVFLICYYLLILMYNKKTGKISGTILMIVFVVIIGICAKEMITKDRRASTLETALSTYYSGYTNFDDDKETFVYDGQKYSYDYDYDNKKLIVFKYNESKADAVYINGQRQDDDIDESN